jgi:hypothetical protein
MRDTPMILAHSLWITLWAEVWETVDNQMTRR